MDVRVGLWYWLLPRLSLKNTHYKKIGWFSSMVQMAVQKPPTLVTTVGIS